MNTEALRFLWYPVSFLFKGPLLNHINTWFQQAAKGPLVQESRFILKETQLEVTAEIPKEWRRQLINIRKKSPG